MQFMHNLSERYDKFKVFRYNVKRSKDIRNDYSYTENGLTFKRGEIKYLKAIQNLHLELFRHPLYPFLVWLYRFRMRELVSVVVDENDNLIAYDLFMFQPVEKDLKVIHEIYVGVRHKYQDKGIGVKLRQYSSQCYDEGYLDGISTLADFDNIKALRTAQKAGFAITKTSAKPLAHYLFKHLTRRY